MQFGVFIHTNLILAILHKQYFGLIRADPWKASDENKSLYSEREQPGPQPGKLLHDYELRGNFWLQSLFLSLVTSEKGWMIYRACS